jgi:hypothetical protein
MARRKIQDGDSTPHSQTMVPIVQPMARRADVLEAGIAATDGTIR